MANARSQGTLAIPTETPAKGRGVCSRMAVVVNSYLWGDTRCTIARAWIAIDETVILLPFPTHPPTISRCINSDDEGMSAE